jgi:exonuclease VII small subunit
MRYKSPLEESLKLFEEGMRLSRFCNQKLDEVAKKVEILMKGKEGFLKTEPFDPAPNSGQAPLARLNETISKEDKD